MSKFHQNIKLIVNILKDNSYRDEIILLNKSYCRLRVRFRNNKFVSNIKHVTKLVNNFEQRFKPKIFESLLSKYSECVGKAKKSTIKLIKLELKELTEQTNKIIDTILFLYAISQAWLNVGHLSQYLIAIRCALARLRVVIKALNYYAEDINEVEYDNNVQENISNINKCRPEIGPIIDRKTMKIRR